MKQNIEVELFRYDPKKDKKPRYETFTVPCEKHATVLSVLRSVYEDYDSSLAFRHSCRVGICGVCTLMVNGRAALICKTKAKKKMRIDPLPNFPVIRDLVVDRFSSMRAHQQRIR